MSVARSKPLRTPSCLWSALVAAVAGCVFLVDAVHTHQIGVGVVAAVTLLVSLRVILVGIRLQDDGVVMVGLLRTRRLAWSEIDHFSVRHVASYPFVVCAETRDGRIVPSHALSSPPGPRSRYPKFARQIQGYADTLNVALAQHGGALPSRGPLRTRA